MVVDTAQPEVPAGRAPQGAGGLEIAFVNNMPDGAFIDTERQFLRLLGAHEPGSPVRLRYFTAASRTESPVVGSHVQERYGTLDELVATSPAGVVVTGCEPGAGDVRLEASWPDLRRVIDWSVASAHSVWLACLAAHAALAHFDGIGRCLLPAKCSGVFEQPVAAGHPLTAGLPPVVSLPHSRLNDVPAAEVAAAGYEIAVGADWAWSLATRRHDGCLLVLSQGHPEYETTSLLREYRRDVRRYLCGERDDYPAVPAGYLPAEAESWFEAFRRRVRVVGRDPALMDAFPFDAAAGRLTAPWNATGRALLANWLGAIRTAPSPARPS